MEQPKKRSSHLNNLLHLFKRKYKIKKYDVIGDCKLYMRVWMIYSVYNKLKQSLVFYETTTNYESVKIKLRRS